MQRKFSIVASPRRGSPRDQEVEVKLTVPALFYLLRGLLGQLEQNGKTLAQCSDGEPALGISFFGTLTERQDVPVGSLIETSR